MIEIGSEVSLLYPTNTHVRYIADAPRRERQLVIRDIRDLVSRPLTVDEFLRRPYVYRSRWLVRAFEPAVGQFRQFYLGSADEYFAPGALRIGLYERGSPVPVRLLAREFAPTVQDRQKLMQLLRRFSRRSFGPLQLHVLCDDFRLHA